MDWGGLAGVFRVAGPIFSAFGAIVLAFRVSGILKSLCEVAKMHEHNIRMLVAPPAPGQGNLSGLGSTVWLEKAQNTFALIVGLVFVALGALLNAAAALIAAWPLG